MIAEDIHLFKPFYRVEECNKEIKECLEGGWTGLGYKTLEIEKNWMKSTGFKNAHFLNSNTAGLFLSFELLKDRFNWNKDSEIISTPLTFIATNHAIKNAGLKVVFADIDETLNLDPISVKSLITKKIIINNGAINADTAIKPKICLKFIKGFFIKGSPH